MADDVVMAITPMTSVRAVDVLILEKGRLAEKTCPAVTVKGVDVPMGLPVTLLKVMLPVHDAAVPVDELAARFATLIWMVSVLPTPTGPMVKSRVVVVVVVEVWAAAPTTDITNVNAILRRNMIYLSKFDLRRRSKTGIVSSDEGKSAAVSPAAVSLRSLR